MMELKQYTIPATGTLQLESANSLFVLSVNGVVEIDLYQGSSNKEVLGNFLIGLSVPAGMRIARSKPWQWATVIGSAGTVIQIFYGTTRVSEDLTDMLIASNTGSITISPGVGTPNNPINHPNVTVAAGTLDNTIPANAARKWLIVGSLSTNAPSTPINLFLQGGAGVAAVEGVELQAGTWASLDVAAEMSVYNGDASPQIYYWIEFT